MTTITLPPLRSAHAGFLDASRRFWVHADRFKGRSSRSEYWWAVLHLAAINVLLSIAATMLRYTVGPAGDFVDNLIVPVFAILTIVPSLALQARRLHDIGRSAWWLLLSLIPIAGGIVLFIFTLLPSDGENRFDRRPPTSRKLSKLRTTGVALGSLLAGQAAMLMIAIGSASSAVLLAALNSGLAAEDVTDFAVVDIPGVFSVHAVDFVDPTQGFTFDTNAEGWQLAAIGIAAVLFALDVLSRRHERRVATQ